MSGTPFRGKRAAAIRDAQGGVVFEQEDIEVPTTWSLTATNVVVSKYFRGHVGTPERETSIRLVGRVADTHDLGIGRRVLQD